MRDKLVARSDDGTPLYLQLARNLRDHIESGGITPGNALPSERDLSEMAGISRVTVRKAIEQLIEEGVLFRKQGSGTFVARRIEAPASVLSSFTHDARSRGEDPGVIWMMKNYAQPTEEEAAALAIALSARVARLGRGGGSRWRSSMPSSPPIACPISRRSAIPSMKPWAAAAFTRPPARSGCALRSPPRPKPGCSASATIARSCGSSG